MDNVVATRLLSILKPALKQIEENVAVTIVHDFSGPALIVKITPELLVPTTPPVKAAKPNKNLKGEASFFEFCKGDDSNFVNCFGKEFIMMGDTWQITGALLDGTTTPILGKNTHDRTVCAFKIADVIAGLKLAEQRARKSQLPVVAVKVKPLAKPKKKSKPVKVYDSVDSW